MQYAKLPKLFQSIIDLDTIKSFYGNDEDGVELSEDSLYRVMDHIESELGESIDSIGLEGPDDMMCSCYADFETESRGKVPEVQVSIYGSFRFCVYGKTSFDQILDALDSFEYDMFEISDVYQPENTVGISFDGVYQDENTTYVSGKYAFNDFAVSISVPKSKSYLVAIEIGGYYQELKIQAPNNCTEEQLKEILVTKYEDKLIQMFPIAKIEFRDYADDGEDYFEYDVTFNFRGGKIKEYLDNQEFPELLRDDELPTRYAAYKALFEDIQVRDISYLMD